MTQLATLPNVISQYMYLKVSVLLWIHLRTETKSAKTGVQEEGSKFAELNAMKDTDFLR